MLEQPPRAFVARREGWRAGSLGGLAEAVGAVGGEDEGVGGGAFGEQEVKVREVGGRVDGGDVGLVEVEDGGGGLRFCEVAEAGYDDCSVVGFEAVVET